MLIEKYWSFGPDPYWIYMFHFQDGDTSYHIQCLDLSLAGITTALGTIAVPVDEFPDFIDELGRVGAELTPSDLVDLAKSNAIKLIDSYDTSSNVNSFTLGGMPLWVSRADRTTLKVRFESELAAGLTATTLWYGLVPIPIEDITQGLAMLVALEVYASRCFDTTAAHKAAVMQLTSVEDVLAYDFTQGYPDKLAF